MAAELESVVCMSLHPIFNHSYLPSALVLAVLRIASYSISTAWRQREDPQRSTAVLTMTFASQDFGSFKAANRPAVVRRACKMIAKVPARVEIPALGNTSVMHRGREMPKVSSKPPKTPMA